MTAILSLLVVIFVSLLITRVATIALAATGLSRESARFQARSALTGSGFTTSESESVVRHPVRRRIVMTLMLLGSAGIAAVIGSIVLAFVQPGETDNWPARIGVLLVGVVVLWLFASSRWVDRGITRVTMWALGRYTSIDVHYYANLLHLGGDYVITELPVQEEHWLADRSLVELDLRREGIIVLGIAQADGTYLGVPKRGTVLRVGDTLVIYSRAGRIDELDQRRRGRAGDRDRAEAVERHQAERKSR
jgi:MFS family permease